jgi:hypothetical protein
VRGEIEIAASSRYVKWFLEEFNLPSGSDTLEQITENLRHALTCRYGVPFTRRTVKNILCKVYRIWTDSRLDRLFCNLAFMGQMLFACKGDGLLLTFLVGTKYQHTGVEDFFVKQWSFRNNLLTVEDVVGKLGMSDQGVPTPQVASSWPVPESLMFGRARTKAEFEIKQGVVSTCDEMFRFNLERICWQLH